MQQCRRFLDFSGALCKDQLDQSISVIFVANHYNIEWEAFRIALDNCRSLLFRRQA